MIAWAVAWLARDEDDLLIGGRHGQNAGNQGDAIHSKRFHSHRRRAESVRNSNRLGSLDFYHPFSRRKYLETTEPFSPNFRPLLYFTTRFPGFLTRFACNWSFCRRGFPAY